MSNRPAPITSREASYMLASHKRTLAEAEKAFQDAPGCEWDVREAAMLLAYYAVEDLTVVSKGVHDPSAVHYILAKGA